MEPHGIVGGRLGSRRPGNLLPVEAAQRNLGIDTLRWPYDYVSTRAGTLYTVSDI